MANVTKSALSAQADSSSDGRSALLDAARELLSENGGSRFSLAEVAKKSGRNTALVSYYFGGKEQMLLAILDEDEEEILPPFQKLISLEVSPEKKLRLHLEGMSELYSQKPYLTILIPELLLRSRKEVADSIAERFVHPIVKLQKELLQEGCKAGAFREVDHLAVYFMIMGGVNFFFSSAPNLEYGFGYKRITKELRERFVTHSLEILLNGLKPARKRSSRDVKG